MRLRGTTQVGLLFIVGLCSLVIFSDVLNNVGGFYTPPWNPVPINANRAVTTSPTTTSSTTTPPTTTPPTTTPPKTTSPTTTSPTATPPTISPPSTTPPATTPPTTSPPTTTSPTTTPPTTTRPTTTSPTTTPPTTTSLTTATLTKLCSPNQELCVDIKSLMSNEQSTAIYTKFEVVYKTAKDIPMHGQLRFTFANGAKHSFHKPIWSSSTVLESTWNPIGGSRKTFRGNYVETNVSWAFSSSSSSSSSVILQFRIYDYMLASRVVYGSTNSGRFEAAFNYANTDRHLEATVYADRGDEKAVYETDGDHPLELLGRVHQTPASIFLKFPQNGEASSMHSSSTLSTWFSEACTFDTVNAVIRGTLNKNEGFTGTFPDLQAGGEPSSPFFVWQFANTMIELANYAESAGLLCDEPMEGRAGFDWVQPGKQVRIEGMRNIQIKSNFEMSVTTTAALCQEHNICQYLLYDAGWYGEEFNDTSDPMKPVSGFDLSTISKIGKAHGIKSIVYINQHALTNDTRVEALARYLVESGVGGVKMGFMDVKSTPGMRRVINYVRIFGRHKLVVNIHDHFCGFGIQRTFPQLLSAEGVAGDEHNDMDYTERALIIPFSRAKAGRMDYTFLIFESELGKLRMSPLAQVAKSVILGVNGLWTIYWYAQWEAISRVALDKESPFSLWNEMSNEWAASVFLDSTPGDFVSVARQMSSGTWYIVALGRVAHTFTWPLSALLTTNDGDFDVQRWTESGVTIDENVVNAESTLTCSVADDTVSKRHSGCILRLTPVEKV